MTARMFAVALLLVLATAAPAPAGAQAGATASSRQPARAVVDDFEDVSSWSAHPADGVELEIGSDTGVHGRALRLDFRFVGGSGYAIARREVALDLPENYRFRFAVRGKCRPNDLELKLIDRSGENVWWCNRRRFEFPAQWDSLSTKKRQITFAWGPAGGGDLKHVAAIEIAITAGGGGAGTVWLDDFTIEPLSPPGSTPPAPRPRASSARTGDAAAKSVDGDSASAWRSAPGDSKPWLALDLGDEREYGGVVIDWVTGLHASDYVLEVSSDGTRWRVLRQVKRGNGGRDYLYLPETESRHLRMRVMRAASGNGVAIREITLQPLAWGESRERFFQTIAREAARGDFPRAIGGEQAAWAVVGADQDTEEALLGEDGMLETGKRAFSIEPFLLSKGELITWSDVKTSHGLEDGCLPIPSVRWRHEDLELTVTAFADESPKAASVTARYRVKNLSSSPNRVTLFLAFRPFQVNPPAQFLNSPGGTAPIRELAQSGPTTIRVNRDRSVVSLTAPTGFGAAAFDEGDIVVEFLRRGRLPGRTSVSDPFEAASGALRYDLDLEPGAEREVDLIVPLHGRLPSPLDRPGASPTSGEAEARRLVSARLEESRRGWQARTEHLVLELPEAAADVAATLRAQLGWILVNRDGPAIQPGSRSYERSWIRDGSLTSTALLRLGRAEEVKQFIEWFARYQFPDGKVPCCVDQRGGDPVPEHDSHGEFIYLVAEYYRYTGDRALTERLWPAVRKAAVYLDSLRQQRRIGEWREPGNAEFFGLLPPSISHEGYSAKPMHSYWDDFFALRGFKDVVFLAGVLGQEQERKRWVEIRDQFARELGESIKAAMAKHKIDYIPGCADLGDYDATSTTIALSPCEAEAIVSEKALRRTFEGYWEFFRDRRDGRKPWDAYTPYEMRTIGSFVRLGWRERANELLTFFMSHRLPPEWRQWPEVVWKDKRAPKFIGDLPHTWVGSDFVRSVLDMLAYTREKDDALVLGAGVPRAWVTSGAGVTVRKLETPYGPLGFSMSDKDIGVETIIEEGIRVPRGGIVVNPPTLSAKPFRRATVNGRPAKLTAAGTVVVRELPAVVVLQP